MQLRGNAKKDIDVAFGDNKELFAWFFRIIDFAERDILFGLKAFQ